MNLEGIMEASPFHHPKYAGDSVSEEEQHEESDSSSHSSELAHSISSPIDLQPHHNPPASIHQSGAHPFNQYVSTMKLYSHSLQPPRHLHSASKFRSSSLNKVHREVVIIGAGISGLKSALDLAKSDESLKITLIEARDRLGGRTHCVPVPGLSFTDNPKYIDLGAAFIEGWEGNPMWDLATKTLDLKPQRVLHDLQNQEHFDFDGQKMTKESVDKVMKIVDELSDIMFEDNFCENTDLSIGEAVQQLLAEKNIKFDNEQEERLFVHCIQNFENHNGGSVNLLSLKYFYDGPEFLTSTQPFYEPDDCDLFVVGGYAKITEYIASQVQQCTNVEIMLNSQVEKIIYEGLHDEKVRVFVKQTPSNNSEHALHKSKTMVLNTDQCICTIPIGVLKKNRVKFVPELPQYKKEALRHIGVGLLDKVVIAFPRSFWKDNMHALNYVSTEAGKYRLFLNVSAYEGNEDSAILVCYVAADAAARMENMPDPEIKKEVIEVLQNCFPQETIPEPIYFSVTRWNNDPYSLGSFSFMSKESNMEDFMRLAEPLGNLFFAGEHTSGHYASMHGAYMSGERAASEVMNARKERAQKMEEKRMLRAQSL